MRIRTALAAAILVLMLTGAFEGCLGSDSSSSSSSNQTPESQPTPTVQCPYPWPSKIEMVSSSPSMQVGQTYSFQARMLIQNRGADCSATPWYFAANASIVWTFSSPSGSSSYQSITESYGVASVSFSPTMAGTYHITAQWIGNEKYQPSNISVDVSSAQAVQCPHPWPSRIDWASHPDSMAVGQTCTFKAQMWVQNRDSSCISSPWCYAPNMLVTWTFTNANGASFSYQTTTANDGTCSVSFPCPSSGMWTVSALWAGNEGYLASSASVTIQAT